MKQCFFTAIILLSFAFVVKAKAQSQSHNPVPVPAVNSNSWSFNHDSPAFTTQPLPHFQPLLVVSIPASFPNRSLLVRVSRPCKFLKQLLALPFRPPKSPVSFTLMVLGLIRTI